jgi:hypothetical protein
MLNRLRILWPSRHWAPSILTCDVLSTVSIKCYSKSNSRIYNDQLTLNMSNQVLGNQDASIFLYLPNQKLPGSVSMSMLVERMCAEPREGLHMGLLGGVGVRVGAGVGVGARTPLSLLSHQSANREKEGRLEISSLARAAFL